MVYCSYGCGRKGKYQFKNGGWCCEEHRARCPAIKERNRQGLAKHLGREKSEEFKQRRNYIECLIERGYKYYPNHFCLCKCCEPIRIRKSHIYDGIPYLKKGHHSNIDNPMKDPEVCKRAMESGCKENWFQKGQPPHNSGKTKYNYEPLRKSSKSLKGHKSPSGPDHYNWKNAEKRKVSTQVYYIKKKLMKEGKGFCQVTGLRSNKKKGIILHLHHILPVRDFPELEDKEWNCIMIESNFHRSILNKEYLYAPIFFAIKGIDAIYQLPKHALKHLSQLLKNMDLQPSDLIK